MILRWLDIQPQEAAECAYALLFHPRQGLTPAKKAEGDAALRYERECTEEPVRNFPLRAAARKKCDAGAGLHDCLNGFDIVSDGKNIGAHAKIGEQRQHNLSVANFKLVHDDRFVAQCSDVDRALRFGQRMFGRNDQRHVYDSEPIVNQPGR